MPKRLALLCLIAACALAQQPIVRQYAISSLPTAAAGNSGTVILVKDGSTSSDCTVGGGAFVVPCKSNGTIWTAQNIGSSIPILSSDPGTPAAGATWYRSDLGQLSFYNGATSTVERIPGSSSVSSSLTFGTINDSACSDQTVTFTGITTSTPLTAIWPTGLPSGVIGEVFPSASNTAKIRLCNFSGINQTLGALTFAVYTGGAAAAGSGGSGTTIQSLSSDPGSPTAGQVWYRSDLGQLSYYNGGSVLRLPGSISASYTLTFGTINDTACSDQTATFSGVTTTTPLTAVWPTSLPTGLSGTVFATSTNNITLRLCNLSGIAQTVGSSTYIVATGGQAAGGLTNPMTTPGDMLAGGTSGTPTRVTAGTSSQVLIGGTTPAFGALNLATMVTGNLAMSHLNSGTNADSTHFLRGDNTWSVPIGFASPMSSVGDLIVGGTSGAAGRLAAGTSGFVLTSTGTGTAPSWQAPAGGCTLTKYTIAFNDSSLFVSSATPTKTLVTLGSTSSRICFLEISGTTSFTGITNLTAATVRVQSSAGTPILYSPNQDIFGTVGSTTNNYWTDAGSQVDRSALGVVAAFTFQCSSGSCFSSGLTAGSVSVTLGTLVVP